MARRRALTLVLIGTLGASLVLTGCGGESDDSGPAAAGGVAEPQLREGSGFAASDRAAADGGSSAGEADTPGETAQKDAAGLPADQRRMVRTAQVDLKVRQLAAAVVKVRAVATGLGGYVGSEDATLGTADGTEDAVASLLLRVPEARFDVALTQVGDVGEVLHRTANSQDVTEEVADLDSRVATQRASVARVRALMAEAKVLKDVVLLEGELSRRQADLEALEARLKSLEGQADLSSITVTLTQPATAGEDDGDENGFLTALRDSWDALVASASAVVTLIAVLLPWTLVALALVAVVVAVRRRRGVRRHQDGPGQPPAAAAAPLVPGPTAPAPDSPVATSPTPSSES